MTSWMTALAIPASLPSRSHDQPAISIRFRDDSWYVEGDGLGDDLMFPLVSDAERLALGLARRRGLAVRIFDQSGRLIETYSNGAESR